MDAGNDTTMADAVPAPQNPKDFSDLLQTNHNDAFAFSDTEKLALQLYDQLRELELQRSLLEAQEAGTYRLHAGLAFDELTCYSTRARCLGAIRRCLTRAADGGPARGHGSKGKV